MTEDRTRNVDLSEEISIEMEAVLGGDISDVPTDPSYSKIIGPNAKASDYFSGAILDHLIATSGGSPGDKIKPFIAKVNTALTKSPQ